MAETNPGQQNVAYDAATNQPRLNVDTTYDENTSLDDIKSKYTDIGDQYNRFVTDARENVHARQVEHIGNDFGASPYNTNTYYEAGMTGFSSAMRQQGTQQALGVGMERGKKEAENNLAAAKSAYDNAVTTYNSVYDRYQKSKSEPTPVTIDKDKLPEGVNEDEFANYIKNSGSAAQGMQRAIDTLNINNAGVADWNDEGVVNQVKGILGENSEAWKAYARHMEERKAANQYGVSERFGDTELGRIWADTYAKAYFQTMYDDSYVAAWQTEYDKVRRLVTNLMGLRNGELSWSDNIVPESDLPDNMCVGTNFQYINIIQPEFKSTDAAAKENVKVNADGSYTVHGQNYSYDEVRQKVAEAKGTTPEELDKKQASSLPDTTPKFGNNQTAFQDSIAVNKNGMLGKKWVPTSEEVWAAFSGGDVVKDMYTGYTEFSISADDVSEAVLGVDVREAKAIAKFRAEDPEGYELLTDQITRAITDATVFEIADGTKKFHTKDGYKVLDAGTVVMHVPDAVLNEDGSVKDEDLKRMIQLYSERDDPTMNEQQLMDEYEKSWKAYATRLAWARAVTNQTDEQISPDIYAALLYSQDSNKYKDVKIGDKTAQELLDEFRRKCETNPEDAYREFTELWQKSYENVGYFFVKNGNRYEAKSLYDENGESMIGRYGEKNSRDSLESNYAMALVSLYANSMDKFNAGQKDGNINPNFIEADGADDWNTFWTTIGRNIQADAHIVLAAAAGGIAGAATGTAAGPVIGNILGGLVGVIGGAIYAANNPEANEFGPGDFGYDVERNNKSSELLREAVNPLSLSLWGLNDSKSSKFSESYATIRGVGNFFRDALASVTTLGIESIATAAVEATGVAALNGVKRGISSAATKLLNSAQEVSIRSVADAAKSGMIQDLMDPTDELGQSVMTNAARDLADPSDEIAQSVANKYVQNATKNAAEMEDDLITDAAEQTIKSAAPKASVANEIARTQSMIDARTASGVSALNSIANDTTNKVMKVISYLANNVDDMGKFSIKFSEEATKWITKKSIAETLAKAGYTNVDDATIAAATQWARENIQKIGGVAARQTYQTALISGFLGEQPANVARASSETLTYLSKAIGKWYENPSVTNNFSGIWGMQATGKMSMEGIKKSFSEILDESARAVASGLTYGKADIVRHLARDGWSTKRLQLMFNNTVFRDHGLADDMLYDIIHGYTVPTIDDEGKSHQVTIEEYFQNGHWLMPLAMNGLQMAGGAAFRRLQSAGLNKQLDKAYRALSATELNTPDYYQRFAEVQKITAKADKLSNKMLDKNLSYSKMKDVADKGFSYVEESNEKLFAGLAKDMDSVDKNFKFKTRAEQAEFLKKRFKAPEAVAQAYVNAQTRAFLDYPRIQRLLGGNRAGTLNTLEEKSLLGKIWEKMAQVADDNRMSIKNNKRLKSIWDKQAEMRRLQKEAVMAMLRGADGTPAIIDLESSLTSWFDMIDDVAKSNVAKGLMTEDQVRIGYLPMTGMLIGEPNDGVPAAARALWLGDTSGHAMAIESADPIMKRELNITDVIKAYKDGSNVVSYVNKAGENVEMKINPMGFQFTDAAIAYRNSNAFHRTVGSILGGDAESTGGAATKAGYVQFFGEKLSKTAAQNDVDKLNVEIGKMEDAAKAKMTDALSKKDLRARKRAEKALSNMSKVQDSILQQMGAQNLRADDLRKAAQKIRLEATKGARPDDAPSVREILGLKNDSEAKAKALAARKQIEADIKKVQSGERLSDGGRKNTDFSVLAEQFQYQKYGDPQQIQHTVDFYKFNDKMSYESRQLMEEYTKSFNAEVDRLKNTPKFKKMLKDLQNEDDSWYENLSDLDRAVEDAYGSNPFEEALYSAALDNKKISDLRQRAWESIYGDVLTANAGVMTDATYEKMIINAAKHNGHYDYDTVVRRLLLDNQKPREIVPDLKPRKDGLEIKPNKKIDAKAEGKGQISNKFIGYGAEGSSTAAYAKQAGGAANVGKYTYGDTVFVSINGKDFSGPANDALRGKTIDEAIKAVESGATIITDADSYIFGRNKYNIGEMQLYNALREKGFEYNTITLPTGQKAGSWRLPSYGDELVKFNSKPTIEIGKKLYSVEELANVDMDKDTPEVIKSLTDLIMDEYNSSDRGLKDQYKRAVQDAFSQAKTIMNDQVKLDDIEGGEGGFARGFFTYLDTVDRLLPDKELYQTAVDSKLINKLNALGKDGITLRQLKDSIKGKIASERTAGNNVDDLITAWKVLDMADDAGTRAAGTGDYTPGKIADTVFEGEGEEAGEYIAEGVSNLYGQRVDTLDAYSKEFSAEDLMIDREQNPAQIDPTLLTGKDKNIYEAVVSPLDLNNKVELDRALRTTNDVISKLTNNGSKLYDEGLKATRKETADLFKTANEIREEINKAVKKLSKTDRETKALVDAEASRRTARQTKYGKNTTASAEYDGSAALGIARPGSAILYSDNPARYNAVAASIRNGEAGLANDVHSIRATGIPDAQSILAYYREGRPGLENLDSLVNFDAGSPAGIYHQLRHAALYLHEKGYDTAELGKKLNAMKKALGNEEALNSYGDIYGNYQPMEFSLTAALAEVPEKTSFFPDSLVRGIDRMSTDEMGKNTWKAVNLDPKEYPITNRTGKVLGYKELEYTSGGVSDKPHLAALEVENTGAEQVFLNVIDENGDAIDFFEKYKVKPEDLDGMRLKDMPGPNGGNLYLYNDNGTLRMREEGTWASDNPTDLSGTPRENQIDYAWTEYLADTKNKKSYDELMAYADELEQKAVRADKKAEKLSGQRVDVEDEMGNMKKKSVKTLVEESRDVNYKKYMSPEDYDTYQYLKNARQQATDFIDGKSEIYHSINGATFNGKGAGYSNMVRLSDFLETYGYVPGSKELNADKFDLKTMRKELRKGNLKAKKNWGKPEIDPTKLPSTMDRKSAELTVANILQFAKQAQQTALSGAKNQYIDFDQIWVDKSYLELLARYADSPNSPRGLMSFASKVSALPQWIQQQQLAGGWGPINALTLAQVRSAILEDPWKAVTFAKMLADFRNSKTAVTSVLERSDLLSQMSMDTMDGSIVTDLYPVMSKRVGRNDGGVIQTFATKILDRIDGSTDRFPKGFRENIKADLEDFFENPTFAQAMPVLRAQMLSMNYDGALTRLQKKFADRIGKDISIDEIQYAARMAAYAKTQKFFTPQKYWSGNMETGLQKIRNQNIRKMVGQITGEGTPTTVLDVGASAFFALRYKQTFVNRFVQGVKSYSQVPRMIKNQLSHSADLMDVAQDLTNVGQMKGIASLIGISVLAKIWCDAMGIPNAWDDFDFNPEGDEVFHMPSVLMKFQNAGQIWLPNDVRDDGTPYVNPDRQAYKLDPFFSMFTLPNSAMRAVNMAFNGGTDSYAAPQGGIGLLANGLGANMYGVNQFFNSPQWRAVSDELIGSNLLSPFKALHEIVVNRTYFGNNIWERKYLPDGSENPNYDPGRNAASSVMHIIGLDNVLDPNGYNRWVKGGDDMVRQDQVGTISGSGILQHEYYSAAVKLLSGDLFGAFAEAGELPIKTQKLTANARTEMNTIVKNTLDHYGDDYRAKIKAATSVEAKDAAYTEYVKKCADEVARWSAKHNYLLGDNQELVASATRILMAMTSGEYDDTMSYVQNAYWKASQIAQIESGTNLFLKEGDLEDWLKNGGTVESFTEEKNKRSQAYNQALDEEWEARKALIDAGYNPEYLAGSSYEDLRAEQRSVSKKIYTSIMSKFEKPVGDFKNYKEMQKYYEEMIANASTTKQKAKLANQYNKYVTDIIAEALADYGPTVLNEATYNGKGITQQISDYIIIPADKYYNGKTPKSSYLKDIFGVGYRNRKNLPSDDELREKWDTVKWLVSHGKSASASAMLETMVKNIKNGRWYASDIDYSSIIKLKSMLRSKQ